MAKKRKAKRQKRREMPPLTLQDKVIYWILGAVLAAALIGLFFLWEWWADRIAFADPEVVASRANMSFLWMMPAWFCLFITALGFWCTGYNGRRPIFGIPGFLYGPPLPRIYPLFMKNKPPRKPADIRGMRNLAGFIIGINLFCLAFVPLSMQGRDSWWSDGTVREFSMFGNVREEYGVRDTEEVVLSAYSYTTGRSHVRHWSIRVELVMDDGASYVFPVGAFRSDDGGEVCRWIRDLVQLMDRYPDSVLRVEDAQELELVIVDHGLTDREAQILRQLFGEN